MTRVLSVILPAVTLLPARLGKHSSEAFLSGISSLYEITAGSISPDPAGSGRDHEYVVDVTDAFHEVATELDRTLVTQVTA